MTVHREGNQDGILNDSEKHTLKQTLPFKRKIRHIGKSFYVCVPKDYVMNFSLHTAQKHQFYVEVEP